MRHSIAFYGILNAAELGPGAALHYLDTGANPVTSTSKLISVTYFTLRELPRYRINHFIRIPEVQLIDEQGTPQGVVSTSQALRLAQEAGLDLVEVNPTARPPIVKIMDYGQFQYREQKKLQAQKGKSKKVDIKGIRISLKIGGHDREVRVKQAKKFFDEGHKVRVEMILRGREKAHVELAREMMQKFVKDLGEGVVVEVPFSRQGGNISLQVARKKT